MLEEIPLFKFEALGLIEEDTLIPVASAPTGTVTSISLEDRTLKEAGVCPKFTFVTLKKFSPVTVIMSPAAALVFSKSPTLIASPEAKAIVGCVPNISFASPSFVMIKILS